MKANHAHTVRLVRGWLFFALALSLLANIGHTLLADSMVPVWLRMIGAVAWPLLVFAGVDITVKVAWDLLHGRRGGVMLARLLILLPAIPAAVTSYEHMHAVLLAMGERPFIASFGPGAVDLMMIGCTITLVLLQRSLRDLEQEPAPAAPAVEQLEQVSIPLPGAGVVTGERGRSEALFEMLTGNEPPPELVIPQERVERKPRAAKAEQEQAIKLMLAGEPVSADVMGASTLRRYQKAMRTLRGNPQADIDCKAEKVRPELIAIIRDAMNRERAL